VYVQRVATVFNADSKGVKGNLAAVVKAILLDDEARNMANVVNPQFGKLREPIYRFLAWARALMCNPSAVYGMWEIPATPQTAWGESFRSGSVLTSSVRLCAAEQRDRRASMVAPEFQIVNESTVVAYVNYMQRIVSGANTDLVADYSSLIPMATTSKTLLNELNILLAAGQLSDVTSIRLQRQSTACLRIPMPAN
jgi:uncharacterized protein (DUF1800 family)